MRGAVGVLDSQPLSGHRADEQPLALVHVGPDVQPHAGGDDVFAGEPGEATRQQVHSVELGMGGDSVDLVDQGGDLHLDLHPVLVGVDAVGGLDSQLPKALQDVLGLLEIALCGLDEGNAVQGVLLRPLESPDLGAHLLGYGQTGGVVPGAVDPHSGGQLLHVLVDCPGVPLFLTVGKDGTHVVVDDHSILLD